MPAPSNYPHIYWWRDPGLRTLNFLLLTSYLAATTNGYTSSLISNLIANPHWTHSIASPSTAPLHLGLVTAAHSLGCIAAFAPAPWLSEKRGRRAAILAGNVGILAGAAAQPFCTTPVQFLAARLVVGCANIFNVVSASALLVEVAHPRQRGVAGALFNACFFVGSVAAAWVAYGTLGVAGKWSWRVPVLVQGVWSVAQIGFVFFCPESPAWLVRNGERARARDILVKYHANGRADDPDVLAEFEKMCAAAEMSGRGGESGWLALCATPGNRRRLVLSVVIGVSTQWVGNGIISFYLAPVLQTIGITDVFQQQGINGGLQIYNWFLAFGAALLSEKAGRRRLFLTSAATMLVFMVLITICSALYSKTKSVASGYAVVVFLFLFLGGYVIGLTPIPVLYVNEIWPSHLRTKGTSVLWVSQAVAVCFNQFVNPVALREIAWRYYLVYVAVLVAVIIFMFFCVPETKGLSLEEVGNLFDRREHGTEELSDIVSRRVDEV